MYYVNLAPQPEPQNLNPKMTTKAPKTTKSPDKSSRKQARVIGFQTASEVARDWALNWARSRMREVSDYEHGKLCWAQHPAEGDKPIHWHGVIEFESITDWTSFRVGLMALDPHSWSDSISKLVKSRRYLGHRDNPLKAQISEGDIHFEGGYTEQDIAEALAPSPSAGLECLVRELARYSATGATPAAALVDLLRKGYEPREVSSVVGAFRALDGLLSSSASRGLSRALDGDSKPSLTPDDPAFFALPSDISDAECADSFADL